LPAIRQIKTRLFACIKVQNLRGSIPFIERASSDRRVVGVDNPGHGESDVPEKPVGIEGYARAVWAVIDALGLGQIDLVGYHTGTKVATEMAWQRPDDVGRIVMISALVLWLQRTKNAQPLWQISSLCR